MPFPGRSASPIRSTIVLHSVSAGGVYCAKTARARAAALGLDYPGVHGAPDLLGPTHYGLNHRLFNSRPSEVTYDRPIQPGRNSFHIKMPDQTDSRRFDRLLPYQTPYNPAGSTYMTSFPKERSFSDHKLPTVAEAPSYTKLVFGNPQDHNKLLSFVNNNYGNIVSQQRHHTTFGDLPLDQGRNQDTSWRGQSGHSQGARDSVFGLPHWSMVRSSAGRGRPRVPIQPPLYMQSTANLRPFVQGNQIFRPLVQAKSTPVRKPW